MSEEKLYVVKNDEGQYFDIDLPPWWDDKTGIASKRIDLALGWAKKYGGHVVTLIEEPEKAVLPRKAAEWIDRVKDGGYDITYIFTEYAMPNEVSDWLEDSDDDAEHREERGLMLINAYLYGYTVAKEKKYVVELDGLITTDGAKQYLTKKNGKWFASRRMSGLHQDFTDKELNTAPEWAHQLNREEVTDDDE